MSTKYLALLAALLLAACDAGGLLIAEPVSEPIDASADAVTSTPGTDAAQFARGQALFSHVWTVGEGLGPDYNATSCAACHSLPTMGGQGSKARRVIVDFPRFQNFAEQDITGRPYLLAPSLLGLGGLDATPIACGVDETMGVHGVAVLSGKPVKDTPARFGHKLGTTDLISFCDGAAVHEVGLCIEGDEDDSDEGTGCTEGEVPAMDDGDLDDLAYFVAHLAAPAPLTPPAGGAALFVSTGCATCHAGPLFTDLCAHDLGPGMADGEVTDQLTASQWRTTPLVYVRGHLAGLMHDGRAGQSVASAIAAHGGEGAASAALYLGLSAADQSTLNAYAHGL